MTRVRVAVALDNVPKMLRDIVYKTLEAADDCSTLRLESVALESDASRATSMFDVLLASGLTDPGYTRSALGVRRLILLAATGKVAEVFEEGATPRLIENVSPADLHRLATFVPLERDVASHAHEDSQLPKRKKRGLFGWLSKTSRDDLATADTNTVNPKATPAAPDHEQPVEQRETLAPNDATARTSATAISSRSISTYSELARLVTKILNTRQLHAENQTLAAAREIQDAAELLNLRALSKGTGEANTPPGLSRIAEAFELTADERDLLFLCSVVELEPAAAALMTRLNDHMSRHRPTVGLIAELSANPHAFVERLITLGPLARYALVSLHGDGPLATQTVKAHPDVWPLVFDLQRPESFARRELRKSEKLLGHNSIAAQEELERARSFCNTSPDGIVFVTGESDVGRQDFAETIASSNWGSIVQLDCSADTGRMAVAQIARESQLANAAVLLCTPELLALEVWQLFCTEVGPQLFVVTNRKSVGQLSVSCGRSALVVSTPRRDRSQRAQMWRSVAPVDWNEQIVGNLAQRFDFSLGEVSTAWRLATTRAELNGRDTVLADDVRSACDTIRSTRFEGTAELLRCPFERTDIVLPPQTESELDLTIAWARYGASIFDAKGPASRLHAGTGLACLFSGPPGTGKTMAAQIIAREVDYSLYRIDLSQVVDKFIGESEKRLTALFDEAERSRVALFFDEADALFGKRTEVRDSHDRYANITIDHLLQKLESFSGLAILATNLAGNIDDAFLRRVRVRAEFLSPGPADRRLIWNKLLPPSETRASDIDVSLLADSYELVGGEIRNALYTAHLHAANEQSGLCMRHCVKGLWRELAKTGRVHDPAHLGAWRSVVVG